MDMQPNALANSHLLWMKNRSERHVVVHVTRPASIIEIAAKTDLIGFANRYQIQASPYRDQVQALPPPKELTSQQFQMTWHSRNESDPGLVWLRDQVRAIMANVRVT
jgi:DNA-binding transcriptional LysR family regulator